MSSFLEGGHMKAIVYRRYGSPDVLEFGETETPAQQDNEVLIKVRAASINPYDWHFMRGTPYFLRVMTGLGKPKVPRLGADVAGHVEAVGGKVTQFKPGDDVFGTCRGSFAEYACAVERALALKPDTVTLEQAASAPIAAVTALQGLRDRGRIQPAQKVLINGAAGGVGTFAVQIASFFGAEVTGVCSARNAEMVRSIGANQAIDYIRENFTRSGQHYDLILDCIGNHSLFALRRILKANGTYAAVGGKSGRWMIGFMSRIIAGLAMSRFTNRNFAMVTAKVNNADLSFIGGLMQSGKVTPVVDRRYGLREVPGAIRYLEEGHARGKVVITMDTGS